MKKRQQLVVILGPTASGKTDLAIKLAKKFNGEIICADSRTIYKGMDIGTAKLLQNKKLKIKNTKYKLKIKNVKIQKPIIIKNIRHYMIDVVRPNQEFTVAQFKQKAVKIIKDIQKRGKVPFLVGGTGLYISAIVNNLKIPRVPPDKKLRQKLEKEIKTKGLKFVWRKLIKLDPEAKSFIQKDNPRRVIRALEVCLKTKKHFSALRQKGQPLCEILQIGLKIPRPLLYKRINQRVEKMIKMGLIKEVKKLAKQYSWQLPSMSGIGYREICRYLQGKISLTEAIEEIKKNTRHYSRRQMTWFKRDQRIIWLTNSPKTVFSKAKKLIQQFIVSEPSPF